jgi:hypothetical protein
MENWIAPREAADAMTSPSTRHDHPRDAFLAFAHGLQSSDAVSQFHGR